MNVKLLRLSVLAVGLLAMIVALSACGKRGDPIRPGEEPAEESDLL